MKNDRYIYLDNHATTMVDPLVVDAMMPFFSNYYGNPSSNNLFGEKIRLAINNARINIGQLIQAKFDEIFFTSGATESINWAIKSIFTRKNKSHIITSTIEHSAILSVCDYLENIGVEVTRINPNKKGIIEAKEIERNIKENTLMVAIAHANNEIGTIQPIFEIGQICKQFNILFFVDAAQSLGKVEIDVKKNNINILAASAHKLYGPKGIGCLFIDKNMQKTITPLLNGGGQESGFRSGTENVPSIIGFGKAAEICLTKMADESKRIYNLKMFFLDNLISNLDNIVINGCLENRLAANLNISFIGVGSDILISNLSDIIVAKGSACSSLKKNSSHVLHAISNGDEPILNSAIRIGIGRFNTLDEVTYASNQIIMIVKKIRTSNLDF
jgi:cysteine desulfurase